MKELELYKKAFENLAKALCENAVCELCPCNHICEGTSNYKNAYIVVKEYFLNEAQKN